MNFAYLPDFNFDPAWLKSRLTWGQKQDDSYEVCMPGYLYAWWSDDYRRKRPHATLPQGDIEGDWGEYCFLSLTSDGGAFRWNDKKFIGVVSEASLLPGSVYCPYADADALAY